jgi:hypothetical protein
VTDLFAAQSTIVARLNAELTSATAYYGSQAAGANSQALVMPCVVVAPGPAVVTDDVRIESTATPVVETHTWRVGVRVSMDTGTTAANRVEHTAGTLVHEVIKALKGYRPSSGYSVLHYAGRDELSYQTEAGYAEVWMSFTAVAAIS